MLNLDYPDILDLFPEHRDPKRSESAAFLIWYFENYYRLDTREAVDGVCDQPGDRGVDGIFVNDNDQTITIFQSKINQSKDTTIGDASLRTFAGTVGQFKTADSIQSLVDTAGTAQVAGLAKRLDLVNKIGSYQLRGEFISNVDIDGNGKHFLETTSHLSFVGRTRLQATYISDERTLPVSTPIKFDIAGFHVTQYAVDSNTKAAIAPIRATELVKLSGISDQSLFAYNVRGPLGRTGVNKDIAKSIRDQSLHKLFPLFHNGITIIAKRVELDSETLSMSDYFVVNGCQSLTSLYSGQEHLTADLRILTKIVQMEPTSALAAIVTSYSNRQNGIKARDFMANTAIQIRLQNEFKEHYDGRYSFEIKRGEQVGTGVVISNEDAGLYLMAFDIKEPWGTHRKYQIFEDKHADLFGRPEVTAHRIVMCQAIVEVIDVVSKEINNSLFAKYNLTRYLLLYIVREILEKDSLASALLTDPKVFVGSEESYERFKKCIDRILGDVVIDLNAEVDALGEDFDYRDKMRDAKWVREKGASIVTDHLKMVRRGKIPAFSADWGDSS